MYWNILKAALEEWHSEVFLARRTNMKFKNATLIPLFLLISASQASAGISSGWLDYFVGKIGKPGSAGFEVMTEDGLILSRLKSDYAAFSFGETRLSDDEKVSEPIDVSEFDFVVEFEVCGLEDNFFDKTIYKLNYRYHTENASDLIDEVLDINEFFNRVRGNTQPSIMTSTKEKLTTEYLLGTSSIKNMTFQTTFSKEKHYIEISVTADALCNSTN